jgi:hypothetical protein
MSDAIRLALASDRVCDVTTRGRATGAPRRIEIWFWRVADRRYLTGSPGADRHWFRNLLAEPRLTFHLKQTTGADLAALAVPITDESERRRILTAILAQIDGQTPDDWVPGLKGAAREAVRANLVEIARTREAQLPVWMEESPLVEIRLDDFDTPVGD